MEYKCKIADRISVRLAEGKERRGKLGEWAEYEYWKEYGELIEALVERMNEENHQAMLGMVWEPWKNEAFIHVKELLWAVDRLKAEVLNNSRKTKKESGD